MNVLDKKVALVGGIEPTKFENLQGKEFEEYVKVLIKNMENSKFILANSDSCPPNVTMENYKMVSKIIDEIKAK